MSGELLNQAYKPTQQLAALNLAITKKLGTTICSDGWSYSQRRPIRCCSCCCSEASATGHLRTRGHDLFAYIHTVQGGAAAETRACASHKVLARPEAPRRSFRPEARGARPGSAPRRASANPECIIMLHCLDGDLLMMSTGNKFDTIAEDSTDCLVGDLRSSITCYFYFFPSRSILPIVFCAFFECTTLFIIIL